MGILHDRRHQWAWLCSWCVWCRSELWAVNWKVQVLLTIGNISCDQLSQYLKMTTTRPSTARALAYLHCQHFLCTWNFDTPKHFGQFWFRLLFIVIRNPLASGIVDPIGSLIGIWCDNLRYVLPSNACLLEFVIAIGFEILACKVYKRGKKNKNRGFWWCNSHCDQTGTGSWQQNVVSWQCQFFVMLQLYSPEWAWVVPAWFHGWKTSTHYRPIFQPTPLQKDDTQF